MRTIQNGDAGSTPVWPASALAGLVASSSMVERRDSQFDPLGLSNDRKPAETSSVRIERSFCKADVAGSIPASQTGGGLTGELALPFLSKRNFR
jgi:hypothetical protein